MDKKKRLEGEDGLSSPPGKASDSQEQRPKESAIDCIDRINRVAYQRTLNRRFADSTSERR